MEYTMTVNAPTLDALARSARERFSDCYTVTVERDGEQLFVKDFDNITAESAANVFDQFVQIANESEAAGTLVRMFTIRGEIASHTVA